jgi:hypothetical protein
MNANEARQELEKRGVDFSEASFSKYVLSGDTEIVALFLAAGISPDTKDPQGNPAVLTANRVGALDIARLLACR